MSTNVDKKGRYIIAKLDFADLTFVLVNIYAPKKINEQELFSKVSTKSYHCQKYKLLIIKSLVETGTQFLTKI